MFLCNICIFTVVKYADHALHKYDDKFFFPFVPWHFYSISVCVCVVLWTTYNLYHRYDTRLNLNRLSVSSSIFWAFCCIAFVITLSNMLFNPHIENFVSNKPMSTSEHAICMILLVCLHNAFQYWTKWMNLNIVKFKIHFQDTFSHSCSSCTLHSAHHTFFDFYFRFFCFVCHFWLFFASGFCLC